MLMLGLPQASSEESCGQEFAHFLYLLTHPLGLEEKNGKKILY
jgi:hypothetical protein